MKKILSIIITIILLVTVAFAVDTSGANAPEVYEGLYPIKYVGGVAKLTSTSDPDWYNYSEGKWANAVTLDKLGQMNPATATEANITGYYVWIPRYAYLIRTGYGTSDEGRIDIRFLDGATNKDKNGKEYFTVDDLDNTSEKWEEVKTVTYVGDRQMDYLVHSAFKFEEELTGIWVGKSEVGKGTGIYANSINIKQDIDSGNMWKNIDIDNSMKESRNMVSTSEKYDIYNLYGLGEEVNTHLIKPTEYGAVVYLENSKYGDNDATKIYRVSGLDEDSEYMAGGLQGPIDAPDNKYIDLYTKDGEKIVDVKGSAYLETSDGTKAWGNKDVTNITDEKGIITKDGAYQTVASDGQATDVGFRVVLTKGSNKNKIKEIYIKDKSCWWLMENGEVWVSGNNSSGQLGVGDKEFVDGVERIKLQGTETPLSNIKEIVINGSSIYYLTNGGQVWVSGSNALGRMGAGGSKISYVKKIELEGTDTPLSDIKEIVPGSACTYYLTTSGEVWVTGRNNYGKLGLGDKTKVNYVEKIKLEGTDTPLSDIKQIFVSGNSAYYLTNGGEVWVSGYNIEGQLGVGHYDDVVYVEKIVLEGTNTPLSDIREIVAGSECAYYITNSGEVWVSGYNMNGQLGVGHYDDVVYVEKIVLEGTNTPLSDIKKIVIDEASTYFLTNGGEVWVCGYNEYGQLGVGHYDDVVYVEKIKLEGTNTPLSDIREIVIGYFNVYYLTNAGEVWVSGCNWFSQLGVGHYDDVLYVEKIKLEGSETPLGNIKEIVTDGDSTYYLTNDGEVWVSGANYYGQLGVGHYDDILYVEKIKLKDKETTLGNIKEIVLMPGSTYYITNDREVWVSGANTDGQLGVGHKKNVISVQKSQRLNQINETNEFNLRDIKEIVTDGNSVYYLTNGGEIWVSGRNDYGQLGVGHYDDVLYVKRIKLKGTEKPLNNIKEIVVSQNSAYYLTNEGEVWVSGRNDYGQLGVGHENNVNHVEKIKLEGTQTPLSDIKKVMCGWYCTFYLTNEGEVWVSGNNSSGQLGIGDKSKISYVEKIKLEGTGTPLSNIKKIISDGECTYYLTNGGEVWVTGFNANGELGMGDKTYVRYVEKIKLKGTETPLSDIKEVMCGSYCTYFLTNGGEVWATGDNNFGKLGLGTKTTVKYVEKIKLEGTQTPLSDIKEIKISGKGAFYLTNGGEVWVSGDNSSGVLGMGNKTYVRYVEKIELEGTETPLNNIKQIVYGSGDAYYLTNAGEVWVSGYNNYGEMGLGDKTYVKYVEKIKLEGTETPLSDIKEVMCGSYCTYFLTNSGEVWVSGYNIDGQLGLGHYDDVKYAEKIKLEGTETLLGDIKEIISNLSSTYYLTNGGDVWVSGKNDYGQLGIGEKTNLNYLEKTRCKEEDNRFLPLGYVTSIYGNSTSTVFEQDNGDIYVIGDNTNNKLGTTGKIKEAVKISIKDIKDAGIGSDFSVFLKDDGSVVGYGNSSKSGNGLTNIAQIAVGDNHAVFLTKSGEIINKGTTTSAYVTGVNNIYKIVAGANHTVVLKNDGTTQVFGQAELGLPDVVDVFAGKDMTVYLTIDGKVHLMKDNILTELPLTEIIYAELNGEQPYFINHDRELLDMNGNMIEAFDMEMSWVKEIKGDVVLTERERVYDLSKA